MLGLNGKPDPPTPPGEIEAVANATGADAGGICRQIWFVLQVLSGPRSWPEKGPSVIHFGSAGGSSWLGGLAIAAAHSNQAPSQDSSCP